MAHANRILTDWFWDPWTMRGLLLVAVVLLCARGQKLLGLWVAGTSAVEWGGRTALRSALGRERPVWEHPVDSASLHALPSGHAMTAAASGVLLLWLARRTQLARAWWVFAVVVTAVSVAGVCFTRMFLGVHWPTDTLAGALLGTGVACASIATWTLVTRDGSGRTDRTATPGR
ncbi:phosphatase PAP2 family protein [Streptomyces sp. P38-E01]|uniref:Phosphatase PAP2 family protein n=1 Tax=Streptomyces tardus TaxID=2780544 RepID=A0A949N5E9_9ACTN|nr:phosphatase PAP2 family protein [Streptomyces tardus]MBU7597922.1 phosphatase PAP2 family protein [Streptomyces tardus]